MQVCGKFEGNFMEFPKNSGLFGFCNKGSPVMWNMTLPAHFCWLGLEDKHGKMG